MPRSRNIKPAFFLDDVLADLGTEYQVLMWGLPTLADAAGRLEDRPRQIKASIFPFGDFDVDAMLETLASARYISRYVVSDTKVIQIENVDQYFTPHRNEPESTLPPHSEAESGALASPQDKSSGDPNDFVLARQGLSDRSRSSESESEVASPPDRKAAADVFYNLVEFWPKTPTEAARIRAERVWEQLDPSPEEAKAILSFAIQFVHDREFGRGQANYDRCLQLAPWLEGRQWLAESRPTMSAADKQAAELLAEAGAAS